MRTRTVLPAVVAGAMIGLNTTGDEDLALTRGITLDIYDDMIIKTEGLQVFDLPFPQTPQPSVRVWLLQ